MKYYRVETRWPKISPRWACLPENGNLTLKRAREVSKGFRGYKKEGCQCRIICVSEKIVK